MKIITLRHGQSLWNIEKRVQGSADIELSDEGVKQAQRAAEYLKGHNIDRVYSSPLLRAFNTAKIVNQHHGRELVADDALKEINFGDYEGQKIELIKDFLDGLRLIDATPPNGEATGDFFARVHGFMDDVIKKTNEHESLLIVSHFGVVRAIICYFLGLAPNGRFAFPVENTAIHMFERKKNEEQFSMVMANYTGHNKPTSL